MWKICETKTTQRKLNIYVYLDNERDLQWIEDTSSLSVFFQYEETLHTLYLP